MAATDQIYREFVRRQHRMLATYLALTAWEVDLDCIVLERNELVRFWGSLKRVEDERLAWFKDDVQPYFKHVETLFSSGSKFMSVYLARRPFPTGTFDSRRTDRKRIAMLDERSVRSSLVQLPSEQEILNHLSAAIHGLIGSPLCGQVKDLVERVAHKTRSE